ncbi:hypothetical protein KM043_009612 [Ampulex compressa]|nr:hypothetical protein KM043_009612 [Ampulex compressa]
MKNRSTLQDKRRSSGYACNRILENKKFTCYLRCPRSGQCVYVTVTTRHERSGAERCEETSEIGACG